MATVYSLKELIEAYQKLGVPVPEKVLEQYRQASKMAEPILGPERTTIGPISKYRVENAPIIPGTPPKRATIGPISKELVEATPRTVEKERKSISPTSEAAGHSLFAGIKGSLANRTVTVAGLLEKSGRARVGTKDFHGVNDASPADMQILALSGMTPAMRREEARGDIDIARGLRDVAAKVQRSATRSSDKGLPGIAGGLAEGVGGLAVDLPVLMAQGPYGLVIDSTVAAYARANPDSVVEIYKGGPKVRGELAATIMGAVQGGVAHAIFKGAGKLPAPLGRPVAGLGMGALSAAEGADTKTIVEQALIGGVLAGRGKEPGLIRRGPRATLEEMRKPASERQWRPIIGEVVEEAPRPPLIELTGEVEPRYGGERNWNSKTTLGYLDGKPVFRYRRKDGSVDYEVGVGEEAWPASPEQVTRIKSELDTPVDIKRPDGWKPYRESDEYAVVDEYTKRFEGAREPMPESPLKEVRKEDIPSWVTREVERDKPIHKNNIVTRDDKGEAAWDSLVRTPRARERWDLMRLKDADGKLTPFYAKNGDTVLKNIAERYQTPSEAFRLLQAGDIEGYVREAPRLTSEQMYGDLSRWLLSMPQVRNTPIKVTRSRAYGDDGTMGRYDITTGEVFIRHQYMDDPIMTVLHELTHRAQLAYEGRTDNPMIQGKVYGAFNSLKDAIKSRSHQQDVPMDVIAGEGKGYGFRSHVEGSVEVLNSPDFLALAKKYGNTALTEDLARTAKLIAEAPRNPGARPLVNVTPIPRRPDWWNVLTLSGMKIGEMKTPDYLQTQPKGFVEKALQSLAGDDLVRTMHIVSPEGSLLQFGQELVKKARQWMDEKGLPGVKSAMPKVIEGTSEPAFASDPKKARQTKALSKGAAEGMPKEMDEAVLARRVPDFKEKLTFDPSSLEAKDVTLMKFQEVERWRQSPEYVKFWDDVYKDAKPLVELKDFVELKKEGSGKVEGLYVPKLTRNCQRANLVNLAIKWGLFPPEFAGRGCWDACWVDRKKRAMGKNEWSKDYTKIGERKFMATTPEGIEKVFRSQAQVAAMKKSPFLRHGQDGCDSHTIYLGLMEKWLAEQKKAGVKSHNVLITAGYAPNTIENYRRLAPYRDMFTMHVSTGGWLPKGEIVFRLNEFRKAMDAGLDARLRVITNKDQLTSALRLAEEVNAKPVDFSNHQFLMDVLAQNFGINTPEARRFYILETPFHNDLKIWKGKKRSDPEIADATECCKPGPKGEEARCMSCRYKCFSKSGKFLGELKIDEGTSVYDASREIAGFKAEMEGREVPEVIEGVDEPAFGGTRGKSDLEKELRSWVSEPVEEPAFKRKLDRTVPEAPGVRLTPREQVSEGPWKTVPVQYGFRSETKEALKAKGIELTGITRRGVKESVKKADEWTEDVPRIGPPPDQTSMAPADVVRFVKDLADIPLGERGGKGGRGLYTGGLHQYTDLFEHPIRFFERVGGGQRNPLKDFFLSSQKRSEDAVNKSVDDKVVELEDTFRANDMKPDIETSKRIGKILISRQKMGRKVLEKMGEKPIEEAEITPGDRAVIKWVDDNLLEMFHAINAARVRAGQEPIEFRQDYFTFLRLTKSFNEEGWNILTAPKKWLEQKMTEIEEKAYDLEAAEPTPQERAGRKKARKLRFPFESRTDKISPLDLDAIGVFSRYADYAYRQMYMGEMYGQWEQVIDGEWKIDGKKWSLQDKDPGLRAALQGYRARVIAGQVGEMPQAHQDLIRRIGNNYAVSRVALNITSIMSQFTSNAQSAAWLGPKYMMKGLVDYGKAVGEWTKGKKEHMSFARRSGDIGTRLKDPVVHDFMAVRAKTKGGELLQKGRERTMRPMQMADYVTAQILWRGAYIKAMEGKAEGYAKGNQQDAVTYANESVARVQSAIGRADRTPFQTTDMGRMLMPLQNFVLNEWGFLTRDILRIGSVEKTRENVDRIATYLLATMVVSALYEEVLGVRSPMNSALDLYQLGKAGKKGYEKGGVLKAATEVGREAAGGLPIVGGSVRFGTQPGGMMRVPVEAGKFLAKPTVAGGVDLGMTMFGIPGGGQLSKTIKGPSVQERVTGKKPETLKTEPKAQKKKRSLFGGRTSTKKRSLFGGSK